MRIRQFPFVIFIAIFFYSCSDKTESSEKLEKNTQFSQAQSSQNIENLFNAALNGDVKSVQSHVENGFEVNQPNQENQTLLMLASFNGHTKICEYLIKSGAYIEARDGNGRTALVFASTGPFPETVKFLLINKADPNVVDHLEKFTPLMHAAAEGHLDVVKVLLENGADKSLKDVDGDTAESFARQNGHIAVADYIKNN